MFVTKIKKGLRLKLNNMRKSAQTLNNYSIHKAPEYPTACVAISSALLIIYIHISAFCRYSLSK